MMHAIRKSDLRKFPTKSQDVCRIEDGSTNGYLREDRVVEDFLKTVEPKYNASLRKLRERQVDQEVVYTIAGFIAYVDTCSPTAMRLGSPPLKAMVESKTQLLDAHGKLPRAPESLGRKTLSELISEGIMRVDVDGKYPQAIGISKILDLTAAHGNSHWDILHNTQPESPFFTTDFPVAIERQLQWGMPINKIVPLAPDVAVRIWTQPRQKGETPNLDFSAFSCVHRNVDADQVRGINRQIVQCAEDLVFYRDALPWVERFVARHREYWIQNQVETVSIQTRNLVASMSKSHDGHAEFTEGQDRCPGHCQFLRAARAERGFSVSD
jgi:hypothetical protein